MKLTTHRSHDYRHLVARWRAVAKAAGMQMKQFATASGMPLYFLKSKKLGEVGGIYISTGIHGDEPGATEGLLAWAEKNVRRLAALPCILFPCLNPWGLTNNRRIDEEGRDLNRFFHHDDLPMVAALKKIVAPYRFAVSLMLHEDYDGHGIYIYETERARPFWAEKLLAAGRRAIPLDRREKIDGRKTSLPGIVRRKIKPVTFADIGFPEAIYFHLEKSERTFTIETPSEFALDQRVAAHVAVIDACVKLALTPRRT